MKKALSLLLAIVMVMGLGATTLAADSAAVTVETASAEAKPGDEVTLAVKLANNTGFAGMEVFIDYDRDRLELTAINTGYTTDVDGEATEISYLPGAYTAQNLAKTPNEKQAAKCGLDVNQKYGYLTAAKGSNITKNGTIFTLTFKVKEEAETGLAKASVVFYDIYDIEFEVMPVDTVAGGINVKGAPVTCKHPNLVAHAAVAATCTAGGNDAYWTCPDCGKMFSDEGVTEINAIPTTPKLNHNYVNGECTLCHEKEPAYELYVVMEPNVDADNDGIIDVAAGQQVTAKLMLRSATDATINSFAANIAFDGKLTAGTPETDLSYNKTKGLLYSEHANISVKAGVPVEIAKFPVTVARDAVDEMAITLSNASVMANDSKVSVPVTTTGISLEIDTVTITFVTASGSYDVKYTIGSMPSFDDVTDEGATTDKTGYTFTGWNPELAAVTGPQTYTAQYKANEYKIKFVDENGATVEEVPFTYDETTEITEPAVPAKNGYEGAWGEYDLTKPEDQTVEPEYTAKKYTVTYNVDGGDNKAALEYTIEDESVIGAATKSGYRFIGWKVETAGGSWVQGASVAAGDTVKGKYGNVTLKAQWVVEAEISFEDYAYAAGDQILLVVQAEKLESGNYMFDGQPLYWTDSRDYGAKGAYITLVDKAWAKKSAEEAAKALTIDTAAETAVKVDRDGDVNGDGKVDVHDAGVVYKILSTNGDAFADMTILDRLECDVVTSQANSSYRGSIADVNAIMDIYLAD